MEDFNVSRLKLELKERGVSDEEINNHPKLLDIMYDYLLNYQNRGPNWSRRGETKKLNARIKAEINIPRIKAEVAALDTAYLRAKLKMQGFTHHQLNYFPELIELKRAKILEERLKKNAK
jgi:hypothetical protein